MKKGLAAFLALCLAAIASEALGWPLMLGAIRIVAGWLRALPAPTEHFAEILVAWAWPIAALAAGWGLRQPIAIAASSLARRMADDKVEIGNWLKISADTPLTTLDRLAVTEEPDTQEAADVRIIEALLEYAGESDQRAAELLNWISTRFGPTFDPELFLTGAAFVQQRVNAYRELIEDPGHV